MYHSFVSLDIKYNKIFNQVRSNNVKHYHTVILKMQYLFRFTERKIKLFKKGQLLSLYIVTNVHMLFKYSDGPVIVIKCIEY